MNCCASLIISLHSFLVEQFFIFHIKQLSHLNHDNHVSLKGKHMSRILTQEKKIVVCNHGDFKTRTKAGLHQMKMVKNKRRTMKNKRRTTKRIQILNDHHMKKAVHRDMMIVKMSTQKTPRLPHMRKKHRNKV